MILNKEVVRVAKLQFIAGQAKPGPALAGLGIVMPEFTKQFNDQTRSRGEEPVPVKIYVYKDKSFSFKLYKAPVTYKILEALGLSKGSKDSKSQHIATLTQQQLREIAEYKMSDMNVHDVEAAMHVVAGSARNMGIKVEGWDEVVAAKREQRTAERARLESRLQG